MTPRGEFWIEHIRSLGFRDIRDGVMLWRLGCVTCVVVLCSLFT